MIMRPVVFNWVEVSIPETGELRRAMVPQLRYLNVAKRQFADGHDYPMVVLEARSRASHNQFFAAVDDAWHNLPEEIAARWPTSEHLRKWALVETGWFDEKFFDCDSPAKAKNLAVFIRSVDTFGVILLHKNKVIVREAKSQSAAAMGKESF